MPRGAAVGPAPTPSCAAVAWTFDPATLDPADRARLEPLVVDPDDERWALLPEERRRVAAASTLAELRQPASP